MPKPVPLPLPDVTEPLLMVGLGNPGPQYARTRHNAGFMAVEYCGRQWGIEGKAEKKFEAIVGKGTVRADGHTLTMILAQPTTFMNLSGKAVQALMHYYKVPRQNMLVIVDDFALPLGKLRLRPSGSEGGHNGLKSISQTLSSQQYARLRLGIGVAEADSDTGKPPGETGFKSASHQVGYVLGAFSSAEEAVLEKVLAVTEQCVLRWVTHGTEAAMTDFNGFSATAS